MGQTAGTPSSESIIEDTVDTIQYEIRKHAQSLKEINSLTYDEFNSCLRALNDLWVNVRASFKSLKIMPLFALTDRENAWTQMEKWPFLLWKRAATNRSCGKQQFALPVSNAIRKRIALKIISSSAWGNFWKCSTHFKRIWKRCHRVKSNMIGYK